MNIKNFRLNLYRLLICGLVFGTFVFQADAQITDSSARLAGSYQLDTAKSANINTILANASRQNGLSAENRMDLETKLIPPPTVSIEINGIQVVLTSSNGNPTTLNADGKVVTAYGSNGTQVDISSSLVNDTLKVSSSYDNTNYSITFRSMNAGKTLQVTRTVKTNYLRQMVLADSFYNRTSSPPVFAGNSNADPRFSDGNFIVPTGTVLNVVMENHISTKNSQNDDRFSLNVTSPSEYSGAVIEGYLSGIERANGVSGTPKMTLNFQKIKLPNGETYDFSGVIQSIDVSDKSPIKSNNEGRIKGQNKTHETIKRVILGAGIGAVIGAAVGGKKGSIIGAAIGGGAGTGTVLLEGNDLALPKGSQINIQSTSPN